MLQLLSALGLLITALLLLVCLRLLRSPGSGVAGAARFPRLERLLLWCAALSFMALALSGFWVGLRGQALSGYLLLLHVSCGGALAATATLALLSLAPRYGCETSALEGGRCLWRELRRVSFWFLWMTLIGVMLTPLAAMLPWLGTDGQNLLTWLHRCCGLAALAAALGLAYAETRLRQAPG
jgi:hypothetical protein